MMGSSDSYSCPNGKQLLRFQRNFKAPRTGVTKSNEVQYRASQMDCATCQLNERCCFNAKLRKVMRSVRGNRQRSVSQRHTYPDRGYRCWRSA